MEWERRLRDLARTQEGLIARFHLPELGYDRHHWKRARTSGRWDELSSRVLRVRGAPESDAQRALAAVLDASPGAVLHGGSALAWFGLRGYNLGTVDLARPNGLSGCVPSLGRLHRLRDLRPHDVVVVGGVPTETALRAIWAEAAAFASNRFPDRVELGIKRIGRLLDEAHKLRLVTWSALHETMNELPKQGRSGSRIMRALAEARPPGASPTESRNEERLEKILADAGAAPLQRQVVVGGYEPIGRADFRDRALPLVIEVNSLTFHTTPSDREADKARYRAFNDAAFMVAVIWEDDLWSHPRGVVQAVEEARRLARAGHCTVVHSPSIPWPT